MTAFMFIYYAGIASCGMQGATKSMWTLNLAVILVISPLLASFGGGFMRDTIFLHVLPVVFTKECIPDILVALIAAFIYLNIQKKNHIQRLTEWFVVVSDASGLGSFISIGAEKSIMMGADPTTTLFCGIFTSLGGGVLSSIFCGVPIWNVLFSSISYRVIAVLGSTMYTFWRYTGMEHSVAQSAIVLYTTISVLVCNQMVGQWIRKYIESFSSGEFICYAPFISYKIEAIKAPYLRVICYLQNTYKAIHNAYIEIRQRIILFHRILQM